jgi:hypothetical protein
MLLNGRGRVEENRSTVEPAGVESDPLLEQDLKREIELALRGLEFGEVTITVRDRRIVQIERIVRIRHLRGKKS